MLNRSFRLFLVALCAAVALMIPGPAMGQSFYGSLVGTVTDPSGGVIPKATITLTNNATAERQTTSTSSQGVYRFVNLIPGTYRLEVEAPGFDHYAKNQIEINVEATVRADVGMKVGSVQQTVEVTSAAPLLQTETAAVGQVVNSRLVENLPLNGRNVMNLAAGVAGVVPQGGAMGSATGKNVFAPGNYQIGGGTANQSAEYFDGLPVNDGYGNIVVLTPSADAVSEFRVQTNSNSAEFGRFTGGVINIASKGGTNNFHGDGFEFFRGKQLNANDFFANRQGVDRPRFTQNQFGGSIGGPIFKDKLFFFGSYEGFRQRKGSFFQESVPPMAFRGGDFSNFRNKNGDVIPIYDPLTQCGAYGNPACTADQLMGTVPQRQQFPGNIIPADRISPVAKAFLNFPIYGAPNRPGEQYTQLQNYAVNRVTGGDNDQGNLRIDYNLSDRQRLFGRFTEFVSRNLSADVYGNGQLNGDPISPEAYTTKQVALGDTFTINPTTVLDVRLGYMRWNYQRTPGNLGIDIPANFGLPAVYGQLNALNDFSAGAPHNTVPRIYTEYGFISTGLIISRDNTYVVTPTLTKILGSHTLKMGGEVRVAQVGYFQDNNPGGTFRFDNLATSQNAQKPGSTGDQFASFLLGLPYTGTVQASPFTLGQTIYQGYFVNDSWQMTPKLTLNLGVRWEIPGVWSERNNNLATYDPTLANPLTKGINNPVTGQPFLGGFTLVNTPQHPERGLRPERFNLLAPRIGVAYRLTDNTVIRAGGGRYFVPNNAVFWEGQISSPNDLLTNNLVSSQDGEVSFLNFGANTSPFETAFAGGLNKAPLRNDNFQQILLGGSGNEFPRSGPGVNNFPGETYQWNLAVQHQFAHDFSLDATYAGLSGMHLPEPIAPRNTVPLDIINQAANDPSGLGNTSTSGPGLLGLVNNPLYGIVTTSGALAQPQVQRGQFYKPAPLYVGGTGVYYTGHNVYHSLQVTAKKRFSQGGTLLAAYTFSKNIGNVESTTGWLESGGAGSNSGFQTPNDLTQEKSLVSFDSRQRLVLNWALDLPFGQGHAFANGVQGFLGKMISGWRVNNIATFQEGYPLGLTATPNLTGFGYNLRPNVVSGCNPKISGAIKDRLDQYFDPKCFSVPARYHFGNESRNDSRLRGPGINNWDITIAKTTKVTERTGLEFRAELFNAFNRVQFSPPNTQISTNPNVQTGKITSQTNDPREVQLVLRLTF